MEWLEKYQHLPRKQKITVIFAGIVLVFLIISGIVLLYSDGKSQEGQMFSADSGKNEVNISSQAGKNQSGTSYFVEILGQVKNPGIYEFDRQMMVLEAVEFAGGFTGQADMYYVHKILALSHILNPREKVYIPSGGESLQATATGSGNTGTDSERLNTVAAKISINNGTLAELMTLPGIGEVTARSIIAARPFATLEQLQDISGLGESKYNKIVSLIVL